MNWPEFDVSNNSIRLSEVTVTPTSFQQSDAKSGTPFYVNYGGPMHDFLQSPCLKPVLNYTMGLAGTALTPIQYKLEKEEKAARAALKVMSNSKRIKDLARISRSLKSVGKVASGLAYVGFGIGVVQLADKVLNGGSVTAGDAFDLAVSGTLLIVSISNPVGLVAIGLYGFADGAGMLDGVKSQLEGDFILYKPSW